jgi:pyruvate/2-oxoglutarate dehydrogenase complex dihydrolipoamide dehydrogenase (E3) component
MRLRDDGRVTVDQQRTSAAGIYADGDVTGPPWLTNRAVAAETVAGGNALGETGQVRGERLPRSVNTRPPLAAVGLTAEQATAAGRRVATPATDLCVERAGGRSLAIPRGR